MGRLSSIFKGLANYLSIKKRRKPKQDLDLDHSHGREANKNEMILRSSGTLNLASVFSKRGQKGTNQDRCIVWEEFGGKPDMIFCGVFDGHGPWGHFVAKEVREAMPSSLLSKYQESFVEASLDHPHSATDSDKLMFDIWRCSYLKTCAAIDQQLERNRKIDAFYSGTTALTVVRQGEHIFVANVGDSRAVLASSTESGSLVAEQLTIDWKPNVPQEAARISECNGRVYSLDDEGGVERLWLPNEESPGLAMSRAFGDYCLKDFGLISVPQITHKHITSRHHFIVMATDGVWDVMSNEEAVEMVATAPETERTKAAKRVVDCAARAWKRKRKEIAMDDISAIVLFFHS